MRSVPSLAAMLNRPTLEWLMSPMIPDVATTLQELLSRPAWMARAACRGEPLELFFPERGQSTAPAKAICARCPVREECLEHALDGHDIHGIFGGLSERQRRQIRSKRLRLAG